MANLKQKGPWGKEVSFHVTDINFFVLQYFIYNLIHEKWQLKRKI